MRILKLVTHAFGFDLVDRTDTHTKHRATALFAFTQFGVQPQKSELSALCLGLVCCAECASLDEVNKGIVYGGWVFARLMLDRFDL